MPNNRKQWNCLWNDQNTLIRLSISDYEGEYIALIFPEATQDDLETLVEGIYDPNRTVSVDSQGIQDLIQILQLEFAPAEGIKQEIDDGILHYID